MKKFLFLAGMVFLLSPAFANEPALLQIRSIQSQIDDCGAKILNANQITKPVIFVYDKLDLLNAPVETVAKFFDHQRPKFNPLKMMMSLQLFLQEILLWPQDLTMEFLTAG